MLKGVDPHRSELMRKVRQRDTTPELMVRRGLHARGFRYSLHATDLPGRPDIVFKSRRKVIFVHGCFWHRHSGCSRMTTPKTRQSFWEEKFRQNMERDARNLRELSQLGFQALIVWECETSRDDSLISRLEQFLGPATRVSVQAGPAE